MLFSKGVAVIALALLHLTSAAPTIDSAVLLQERDPNQVGLTNGERISRGLGVNKPKRLFGETKTLHAPPVKRSTGAGDFTTSNLAFTTSEPNTKRAASTFFATVINGQLVGSTDSQDAANLIMPFFDTGAPFGSIAWVPSTTSGDFAAGQRYEMYGVMTNGIVSLRFGTPPANGITDLFAPPNYAKGLQPRLVVEGGASRDFIWVIDSDEALYLASDIGTAVAQLSGVRALLPMQFTRGSFPDFTDALATKDTALINPARLWVQPYGGNGGYVKLLNYWNNDLAVAYRIEDSTIFYAPNLLPGMATPQRIIASLSGKIVTVIAKAVTDSVDFVVTDSNTTDSLLFTVPSSQAGVLDITVNGATDYILGMSIYSQTLGAAVDWKYYRYGHVQACIEMVPIGAEPQFCAPVAEEATFAINPSSFYGATRSGSVGGFLQAQSDGKLTFASSATNWYVPRFDTSGYNYDRQYMVYSKVGNRYLSIQAPNTGSGSSLGPFILSTEQSLMSLTIPSARSGLVFPPKSVSKYYYNPVDQQIYAFDSDSTAQAYASGMEELCLESVLPGAAPASCAWYFQTGAADVRERNPMQIYARQKNANGAPIVGWVSNSNVQLVMDQASASTWYVPGGAGSGLQIFTEKDRQANVWMVRPGTGGGAVDQAQTSLSADPPADWRTDWLAVSKSGPGAIIQPLVKRNGIDVTWVWTLDPTDYYKIFRITPNVDNIRGWLPNSVEFCFETVEVGGTPVGACEAADV